MVPKDRKSYIDSWVEAALQQYGEAEPRPGLETRVLANLRVEQQRVWQRRWMWWPAVTALAAMLVAAFLMRTADAVPEFSVVHQLPVPVVKSNAGRAQEDARVSPARSAKSAVAPRLDQFPSPQPLNQQEQMLASYVREFPREAVFVARAQTELLKQDAIEQLESERQNGISQDSDEPQ
jgi:hypothetical protein